MRVLTFILADLETGRPVGQGVICPEARYATVASTSAPGLSRRFAQPADWRLIELAVQAHLPPTPLESTHPITRVLIDEDWRTGRTVQYVGQLDVDVTDPFQTVAQLDAILEQLAPGR